MLVPINTVAVGTPFKELDSTNTKPMTITKHKGICKTDRALIHLSTTRGDWCINALTMVDVL